MDALLYTERNSSAEDPRVMQSQTKMQCTWRYKNSVKQNNLNYGYNLLKEIPIFYYKHIYSLGL